MPRDPLIGIVVSYLQEIHHIKFFDGRRCGGRAFPLPRSSQIKPATCKLSVLAPDLARKIFVNLTMGGVARVKRHIPIKLLDVQLVRAHSGRGCEINSWMI
ncbi:ALI_collapsed_G0025390.mRNA.1.CDS.1 [Saccharomyces cerevisiae]|nr:ALI_collapsed_G0025390.mRNA.1.CDS.1 [Saccharomyces cerevisiae]